MRLTLFAPLLRCSGYCLSRSSTSYALWQGIQCCCGDKPDEDNKVADSECNKKCSGDSCGGPGNEYSVYTSEPVIHIPPHSADTCDYPNGLWKQQGQHYYWVTDGQLNYANAKAECERVAGGQLAEVLDRTTLELFYNELRADGNNLNLI